MREVSFLKSFGLVLFLDCVSSLRCHVKKQYLMGFSIEVVKMWDYQDVFAFFRMKMVRVVFLVSAVKKGIVSRWGNRDFGRQFFLTYRRKDWGQGRCKLRWRSGWRQLGLKFQLWAFMIERIFFKFLYRIKARAKTWWRQLVHTFPQRVEATNLYSSQILRIWVFPHTFWSLNNFEASGTTSFHSSIFWIILDRWFWKGNFEETVNRNVFVFYNISCLRKVTQHWECLYHDWCRCCCDLSSFHMNNHVLSIQLFDLNIWFQ